jgi:hypothetical protein
MRRRRWWWERKEHRTETDPASHVVTYNLSHHHLRHCRSNAWLLGLRVAQGTRCVMQELDSLHYAAQTMQELDSLHALCNPLPSLSASILVRFLYLAYAFLVALYLQPLDTLESLRTSLCTRISLLPQLPLMVSLFSSFYCSELSSYVAIRGAFSGESYYERCVFFQGSC